MNFWFQRLLRNRYVNIAIMAAMMVGVFVIIYTPDQRFFIWSAGLAIQTMVMYLFLGLFFLVFRRELLMFLAFGCAGLLALFLKSNSNPNLKLSIKEDKPLISIATFTSSPLTTTNQILRCISFSKSEIVCLQEIDSVKAKIFNIALRQTFPFHYEALDSNFGSAIYSKIPFKTIDTIGLYRSSAIVCSIKHLGSFDNIYITLCYGYPSTNKDEFLKNRLSQNRLIAKLSQIKENMYLVGELNAVSWSSQTIYLRSQLGLLDSRRAYYPALPNILEKPTDHLFYPESFNCIDYHEARDSAGTHLGIYGAFQAKI